MPYLRLTMNLVSKLLLFSLWMCASQLMAQSGLFTLPSAEIKRNVADPSESNLAAQLSAKLGTTIRLELDTIIESQIGKHTTFSVYFQETPVYGYFIKLNEFLDGSNSVTLPQPTSQVKGAPTFDWDKTGVNDWLRKEELTKTNHALTKGCYPERNELRNGWIIHYTKELQQWESLISATGEEVYSVSRSYYSKPDTMVKALVFLPDPITQARTTYGNPYLDNNDMNSQTLNQWLMEVAIKVRWDSVYLVYRLESDYCVMTDQSLPDVMIPSSSTGEFIFERGDPQFEAVNVFYHINVMQDYLQSLGFFNLVNYPITIDPQGQNGADQSVFFPFGPSIEFGIGGVDDGEDADVIVHEYGHAISHSCAPNTNSGTSRQALDEGFGDYLAVSYSLALSDYKAYEVFNWDGHNEFWDGREANVTRTYPSGLTDNIYGDGEMWSSTLLNIQNELGRERTDSILLNSMYSYFTNMSLPQAASLFMQADSLLFTAANSKAIRLEFCRRGLLEGCEDTIGVNQLIQGPYIANTENFAINGDPILLYSNQFVLQYVELFALNGTLLETIELEDGLVAYELEFPHLRNGIYVLQIHTTTGPTNYRILRQGSN